MGPLPVISPPRPRTSLRSEPDHPYELFNSALEAFERAQLSRAVVLLRAGFFANLYIAPMLLGEEHHPQRMWYSSADGEPLAAREYLARYGRLWESRPEARLLLKETWNDPIVRAELRGFINLSRNLLTSRDVELADRLHQRSLFMSPQRLERTQSEILERLGKINLKVPAAKPRLALVMLASRDPAESSSFYSQLLGVAPREESLVSGGYVEFDFEGIHLAIHGRHHAAANDPFELGPAPRSFGWGAIFVFRVSDFDRHYENALAMNAPIVHGDLRTRGSRSFVTKDPSGYLIELTESEPRGLEDGE